MAAAPVFPRDLRDIEVTDRVESRLDLGALDPVDAPPWLPENLALTLTLPELRDLLAFLTARR